MLCTQISREHPPKNSITCFNTLYWAVPKGPKGATELNPQGLVPKPVCLTNSILPPQLRKGRKAEAEMSINWVMIPPNQEGFIKLPNERILYTSPPRTSLSLSSTNTNPGIQPWSVKSDGGIVYITNQRIVYLPTSPTPELQSFSAPILNLQDTYVRAPFFGANYWNALVRPVAGGGIPPNHPAVELRMIFREGGAFDYHTIFEQIKERLHHAIQTARDEGRNIGSVGVLGGADLVGVHLEQLPAYEPSQQAPAIEPEEERDPVTPVHADGRDRGVAGLRAQPKPEDEVSTPPVEPPNEPPPGYEEAQAQAVGIDLDQRLREEAERGSP